MNTHQRFRNLTVKRLGIGRGGMGVPCTLRKVDGKVYNEDTDRWERQIVDYPACAVRTRYKQYLIDGVNIFQSDVRILLSPELQNGSDCPVPTTSDFIVFDDQTYSINAIHSMNGGGIEVGWEIRGRVG